MVQHMLSRKLRRSWRVQGRPMTHDLASSMLAQMGCRVALCALSRACPFQSLSLCRQRLSACNLLRPKHPCVPQHVSPKKFCADFSIRCICFPPGSHGMHPLRVANHALHL